MKKLYSCLLAAWLCGTSAFAQNFNYAKHYDFKQNSTILDELYLDNREATDSILATVKRLRNSGARNIRVEVWSGSASLPAGTPNYKIAEERALSVKTFLSKFMLIDPNTLVIKNSAPAQVVVTATTQTGSTQQTAVLSPVVTVNTDSPAKPATTTSHTKTQSTKTPNAKTPKIHPSNQSASKTAAATTDNNPVSGKSGWAVSTNLAYDLARIPNIGFDVYVAKNWSVGANWMYANTSFNENHTLWINGGDVHVDYWFDGSKSYKGHHVGAIGQVLDYRWSDYADYYSADGWNFAGGITYGYAWSINDHFTMDFALGVGYFRLKYVSPEYVDLSNGTIKAFNSRHGRSWYGPTKAEITLKWKL